MASIISAGTTSGTALNMAGDTSGVLQLATNGSTTAITIDTSQNVGIGTASPDALLTVNTIASFGDGAVGAPSIAHKGDLNTGIFFSAADTIDFAEGGAACGQFDSSGNFKFNSGYGSVATAYGCRAWVNFNGTSTVAIRGSGNVTSITDNGTGDYTVNFTTALPDANYSAVTSGQISAANTGRNYIGSTEIINSSSVRIRTVAGDGVFYDYFQVFCSVFR